MIYLVTEIHCVYPPYRNLDDVFVEKEEIAKDIKEELTKSMSGYGRVKIYVFREESGTSG